MSSKLQKLKNFYNENGIKETLKIIYRQTSFKLRYHKFKKVYTLSRKEKKEIHLKSNKKIYIFANSPYFDFKNNKTISQMANAFNSMGFNVEYYFAFDANINKMNLKYMPITIHQKINKINKNYFKKILNPNDIFIFESSQIEFLPYLELANSAQCNIVFSTINYEALKKDYFKFFLEKATILIGSSNLIEKELKNHKIANKPIIYVNNNDEKIPNNMYTYCTEILDVVYKNKKCSPAFYNNISIIILNYNNKNIIENCLNSILLYNERYNVEIIVVDNQSTDGSYELLLEKYINKIKLFRNSKNGCSSGRNLGVKNSTKNYIMFLDSDQWVNHKYWLDAYIEILDNNPNIGVLGWAAGWFNKKGYSYHVVDSFPYKYLPPIGLYRSDIGYLGTGGMILKKDLFNKIGGFDLYYDPTCYEDTDLSLSIRNKGFELAYTTYLGVTHLPHQTTKSGSENHANLIKNKGDYFVSKWKKINSKLLKYRK